MQATRLFTFLLVSFFVSATAESVEAQTITHIPLYTFHGDDSLDHFGDSVSGAGDVDGDGMADLIVGARLDDDNGGGSGSARVLSGSDGSVLYNFYGDNAGDDFGHSVSGAGDVDGDGMADLIIGALGDDNNGDRSGSVRVLSGSDGSVLYSFDGDRAFYTFGGSVSGAGDVNGDGIPDLIVGALGGGNNGVLSGSARVLSGSDGSVLHNFYGDNAGDWFGISVSGAGDVNGDGMADLIVGASNDDNNGDRSGSARVLSGSDGSVLYSFDGDGERDRLGYSVSGAGDVDGDGMADLFVGARWDDSNGVSSGSARVLSGSDGRILHNFDGESAGDVFGLSVSKAGDVNGDGVPDLIVGAPEDDNNGERSGSARVLSGSDGEVLYAFSGDSTNDSFGISVSGAGDVNGDGIDDFIVGANRGGANDGGYARVFVSQIAEPEPELLLGDCNQDGVVNFFDVPDFLSSLFGSYQTEADINEDGSVDFRDIGPFIVLLFIGLLFKQFQR